MINKEKEYNKRMYDLMHEDFKNTTEDKVVLSLLKELILSDINNINNEKILKGLLVDDGDNKSA